MKKILPKIILSGFFYVVFLMPLHCEDRIPFSKWPQAEPKLSGNITVLIATNIKLACQGFCGASTDDFNKNIIWFPNIYEGTEFVNTNPGYGTVNRDINIVFFDKNWNVINIKSMKKNVGTATAPKKTYSAIEGIPQNISKLNFRVGHPSPFRIQEKEGKYFLILNN
jgi:hypothetical protein